ncbi:MAG: hypothetical protein N2712_03055 [Brevinematales bacterium]|nr:hypothetical protein [Brevinematales bacterium]
MNKESKIEFILNSKLLFIIRTDDFDSAMKSFDALVESGAKVIEFTSTIPNYHIAIRKAKTIVSGEDILIGAGTVLDVEIAKKSMEGDPDFLVNPTQNFDILDVIPSDKVVFMGGFTPTEIIQNFRRGVDFVKIFPAFVLGHRFISSLKMGPLPFIRVLSSGGMSLEVVEDYIKAGADVIGLGSEVVKKDWIRSGDYNLIKNAAKEYILKVNGMI